MTNEQAKSELMQLYMSLSEEKKKALDVAFKAMEQADGEYIPKQAVLENIDQWYEDKADIEDLIVKITYIQGVAIPTTEPKWIPVSERLPETNDDVLVTDGVDMFVAWYSRKDMWQGWMSSDNNFERNTPIEAWMPLPKPYEPQESEEV